MRILFAIALMTSPALAETCPPAPDHDAAIADLIEQVQQAETEADARLISNQMWEYWADAPDESAQALLDAGMQRRASYDLLNAIESFDRLIAYCPEYAEGYNQRAFANFIRQDYAAALPDLNRAIELSPTHIAAIAGRAMTYMVLGQDAKAQDDLARALELNPWLPERRFLSSPRTLVPMGKDL
ncbi:tetratricopeptide repeat protein [Shimia biformata]|uniref:tetratricopeptide repeat protein n=1 Tax=Shimia biformata TaxID=1294299 RepID=UPI0019528D56|nr:tetratricopeptide repeat protein [Shimia biformata]